MSYQKPRTIEEQIRLLLSRGMVGFWLDERNFMEEVDRKGGAKPQIIWEFRFERRRGEAPIGIQPRATLWVWMYKLTGAL